MSSLFFKLLLVFATVVICGTPFLRTTAQRVEVSTLSKLLKDLPLIDGSRGVCTDCDWLVIVMFDPECPVANAAVSVVAGLSREFPAQTVRFAGAYVDPSADIETLRKHATEYAIPFPMIDDREQHLARAICATYLSEAVIINSAGHVCYRGRIDDRVGAGGASRPLATRHDLRLALRKLLVGEMPAAGVRGFGCPLPQKVAP